MDIELSLHLQPIVAGILGVFVIILAVAIIFRQKGTGEE